MKKTIWLCAFSLLWGCSKNETATEKITPVPFNEVSLTEGFWKDRMKTDVKLTQMSKTAG